MKGEKTLLRSDCDDWATPQPLFNILDGEFDFHLDAYASWKNKKCKAYFNKRQDGLKRDWSMYKSVFVNPPYSMIAAWVEKCYRESLKGAVVVLLIPARVDTNYFHEFIFPFASEIRFIHGRLKFNDHKNPATFPSVVVVFDKKKRKLFVSTIKKHLARGYNV